MEGDVPTAAPGLRMAGEGKPPLSRLQKQAPESLQIDPAAILVSRETVSSCVPIPLLSPLVLSPERPAEKAADRSAGGSEMETGGSTGGEQEEAGSGPPTPPSGWQHPAAPEMAEASTLPSLFQVQCMLANHAQ